MLGLKSSIATEDDIYLGPTMETRKHHKPRYCRKCGGRLAECNATGECFRDCKGTGFKVLRKPKARTYYDARACKLCGSHERYVSNSACLKCQAIKSAQSYHTKKGARCQAKQGEK